MVLALKALIYVEVDRKASYNVNKVNHRIIFIVLSEEQTCRSVPLLFLAHQLLPLLSL